MPRYALRIFVLVCLVSALGCAKGVVSLKTGTDWSFQQGVDAQKRGQYEAALYHYNDYVKSRMHSPENLAAAYNNMGNIYLDMKEYDRALQNYDKAIEMAGEDNAPYLLQRGVYFVDRGQYDEAITDLDKVLYREPESGRAYYYRGLAWKGKGDMDRALRDLERASLYKQAMD